MLQKGFSKILIIVIVLVVIGGSVLIWQWPESPLEELDETKPPIVEEDNQPPADELTGWETHQFETSLLGFVYGIEYPKDWYLKDNFQCQGCLENLYIENMEEKVIPAEMGNQVTESGSSLKVFILDSAGAQSINEWIENLDIPDQLKSERLESITAVEIGDFMIDAWEVKGSFSRLVEFIRNDLFYRISYFSGSQEQFDKDSTVFKEMISSFQIPDLELIDEKAIGYISNIYEENGKKYLDIDYIQWLTGNTALQAVIEDGNCSEDVYPDQSQCIPNGFYVRNQNSKIRTFEISETVVIKRTSDFKNNPSGEKLVNYQEFKSFLYFESIPFNIEVEGGVIVKITEKFIP